jgi:PAS domain-containing protein
MTVDESREKIEFLERCLHREKTARVAAESIFEVKNREVDLSNQKLVKAFFDLEKLTVAVEQSTIIMVLTDLQGVVEYVNKSFTAISGYTKQQAIGEDIRSLGLILGIDPLQGIKHVIKHKTVWQGEVE